MIVRKKWSLANLNYSDEDSISRLFSQLQIGNLLHPEFQYAENCAIEGAM